jgi:chromosome segregation ATPase
MMALSWVAFATCVAVAAGVRRPSAGTSQSASLLQMYDSQLAGQGSKATPLAKVVDLLKSMEKTCEAEMEEDQKLYEKLKCWCEDNTWNRGNAIEESKAKIEELEALIESLTGKKSELEAKIAEVKSKTDEEKAALAEAQALRDKQLQEFHGMELDNIQNIENLKAAIIVLGKHHDEGVFSQFAPSLLQMRDSEDEEDPTWTETHEATHETQPLEEFMQRNDYGLTSQDQEVVEKTQGGKFLQRDALSMELGKKAPAGWAPEDVLVVRKALKTVKSFLQSKHEASYYPTYASQSGEILGILKQMKEEMEMATAEGQKLEAGRSEDFSKLRAAKTAEIEAGERMEEQKEDELAKTANALAEAKEDVGQEKAILEENENFLKNMKKTCGDAEKNFDERKQMRQAELEAIAQTIEILTTDEAKDAASGTYSLVQLQSSTKAVLSQKQARSRAAATLRAAAMRNSNGQLAMLATTVELDAFEKVKEAIDEMIVMLKKQQEDEVKKNDWCKEEFKENEMTTLKTEDRKADLEAKIALLESDIKKLQEEIMEVKKQIEQAMVTLQKAGLDRQAENFDFQKTIADQTVTVDVINKALDRLAKYYKSESFLQQPTEDGSVAPVAQMEYKPSAGAAGVTQMLEKLAHEAEALMAESRKAEQDSQTAYEVLIGDTNAAIAAMSKEVVSKTKSKAKKEKAKMQAESDLIATVEELEGLAKYLADLHMECDFLIHNFDTRQESRGAEIEALQQAKQILNGANLG